MAARDASAPFASVADFAHRVDPKLLNKMQIENLAKAGAFDRLEGNRARLVAGAEVVLRRAQAAAEDRTSAQIGLFGGAEFEAGAAAAARHPGLAATRKTGFRGGGGRLPPLGDPLDTYKAVLKRLGVTPFLAPSAPSPARRP